MNPWKKNQSPYKKYNLWIAVFLSLLLHILLFAGYSFSFPETQEDSTLEVSLTRPDTVTATINHLVQKLDNEAVHHQEMLLEPVPLLTDNIQQESKLTQHYLPPESTKQNQYIEPETDSDKFINKKSQLINNYEPMPPAATTSPASWVEIIYDIRAGNNGQISAVGLHHFEVKENSNYQIHFQSLQTDPSSSVAHFFFVEINGRIYRKSLGPAIYLKQGELASKLMALTDISADIPSSTGRMPDNILDKQSLTYQFMFFPPVNKDSSLTLTDGNRINSYIVQNEGMSILENNNFGKVRVVKIVLHNNDNNEKIEMWLSPEYRYLPLKIKHSDNNGLIIEEEATAINIK